MPGPHFFRWDHGVSPPLVTHIYRTRFSTRKRTPIELTASPVAQSRTEGGPRPPGPWLTRGPRYGKPVAPAARNGEGRAGDRLQGEGFIPAPAPKLSRSDPGTSPELPEPHSTEGDIEGRRRRWSRSARFVLRRAVGDRFRLLLIPPFLAYVVFWSYVDLARLYALQATVYDLGYNMQLLWFSLPTTGSPGFGYLIKIAYNPVWVLFSPLSVGAQFPVLLVVQAIALAFPAFLVYEISKRELGLPIPSYLIALGYLLYPLLAGPSWFDFHFQAFFVLFFLGGYYFLQRERRWAAGVLLILGGEATYPYGLLIVLFATVTVFAELYRLQSFRALARWTEFRFFLTLGLVAALLLEVHQLIAPAVGVLGAAHAAAQPVAPNLGNVLFTVVLILAPLGFLPLLAPRWLILLAPFAYLLLFSGSPLFAYPLLLQDQYSAMIIPFVFLGFIAGVARLARRTETARVASTREPAHRTRRSLPWAARERALATVVPTIAIAVLLGLAYQPYGPWNPTTGANFGLGPLLEYNRTSYDDLAALAGLIPASSPYVLFQNNMPEVLPRPAAYEGEPLTTYLDWGTPTRAEADTGHFSLVLPSGNRVEATIDFALSDPYTPLWFTYHGPSPNTSMYDFIRVLYESGAYGILGEAGGMVLLERNYTGAPRFFVPFESTFSSASLRSTAACSQTPSAIVCSNVSRVFAGWYGPSLYLSPGTYEVRFSMMTTDTSVQNQLWLLATANSQSTVFPGGALRVTGADFGQPNVWKTFTLSFTVNDTYANVEFPADSIDWNGSVSLSGVTLEQLAPGADRPPA